jgi:dephospho-CoA kinase
LLSRYNAIVHPAVAADTQQWANNHAKAPYILKEAALLVETGSYKLLDKLIVVTAPVETRIQRVIQRDNIERHEVEARLKHQLPDEEKINYADFIIVNDGEKSLINQVSSIHTSLLSFIS